MCVNGCHNPTLEEISTVLCLIETVLNSMPLTPITSSPLDLNYFNARSLPFWATFAFCTEIEHTRGKIEACISVEIVTPSVNLATRSNEYLCSLKTRNKWTFLGTNLKVGDMVVVKHHKAHPPPLLGFWTE